MNQTHKDDIQNHKDLDKIMEFLSIKKELDEKTRINLYLPKLVVRLIDSLAKDKSRGELVSSLVIKEARKMKKTPYGMFSPLEISEKEIGQVLAGWQKKANELV